MNYKKKSMFPFMELPKNKNLTSKAKALRKVGILSEVLFWKHFKSKELIDGWDIDRQVIIGNYIVDFFIAELGLIIEIDGSTHDFKYDYDKARDAFFDSYDLEVIHIKDIEVKRNIDGVHKCILNNIRNRVDYLSGFQSTPSRLRRSTPSRLRRSTPSRLRRSTPQEGNKKK